MSRHGDIQVTKRLVWHTHILTSSIRHHLCIRQVLCLLIFTFKYQSAYFRQCLFRIGIDDVVRLSCPNGLFIQLDMLHSRCAKHHTTYHTITYRQCLCPGLCRLVVPQSVLCCNRDAAYGEEEADDCDSFHL